MHRKTWSFDVVVLQRTAKKCTKNYNARAQLLFCSLSLLFGDVLVTVVVVVCLSSLMIHNDSAEDKLRAKRNLIHEAGVITSLCDHEGLPLFFGVITAKKPLCFVTQFHEIHKQSVTLQQAANASMIKPSECLETFAEICLALQHVHSRGFLHNDVKSNNVVLERRRNSNKYNAILIDFGKSTQASTILTSVSSTKRAHHPTKSYLAPEVLKQRRYSTASDIYSVGRMIKSVSKIMGFYERARVLVKNALAEEPSLRPHLDKLIAEINAIQF